MRALLSLAGGSFGIGMTEFVIMGLLPEIAQDLLPDVWVASSEQAIGQSGVLISLYALGVVIGAPTIAGAVARFPRHRVMLALAIALTLGNALTVVLPGFGLVGASRLLAGLPHGAYFGIGALVAAAFGLRATARALLGAARRPNGLLDGRRNVRVVDPSQPRDVL